MTEDDMAWLKREYERTLNRARRLRRRGNENLASQCDAKAARLLRMFNALRLAEAQLT